MFLEVLRSFGSDSFMRREWNCSSIQDTAIKSERHG